MICSASSSSAVHLYGRYRRDIGRYRRDIDLLGVELERGAPKVRVRVSVSVRDRVRVRVRVRASG